MNHSTLWKSNTTSSPYALKSYIDRWIGINQSLKKSDMVLSIISECVFSLYFPTRVMTVTITFFMINNETHFIAKQKFTATKTRAGRQLSLSPLLCSLTQSMMACVCPIDCMQKRQFALFKARFCAAARGRGGMQMF